MMTTSDIRNLTSLSNEARQAAISAFDALGQWRGEISSANDRYLTKALDQMAAAQRAMGWPDHVTTGARELLLKASKMQAQTIDQVMHGWEQQLKSANASSESFRFQSPAVSGSAFTDPVSEMMRLGEMTFAPFKLWMQAAEMWQHNWAAVMSGLAEPRPARPIKKAA